MDYGEFICIHIISVLICMWVCLFVHSVVLILFWTMCIEAYLMGLQHVSAVHSTPFFRLLGLIMLTDFMSMATAWCSKDPVFDYDHRHFCYKKVIITVSKMTNNRLMTGVEPTTETSCRVDMKYTLHNGQWPCHRPAHFPWNALLTQPTVCTVQGNSFFKAAELEVAVFLSRDDLQLLVGISESKFYPFTRLIEAPVYLICHGEKEITASLSLKSNFIIIKRIS
jgi:hypothetical protein